MAAPDYTDFMKDEAKPLQASFHTDVCLWLDYYGDLLSRRQRQVLTLYFDEDWSLSEIAKHTGLSRQGIHDQIRRGVARLSTLEDTLELARRDRQMQALIKKGMHLQETGDREELGLTLEAMMKLLEQGPGGKDNLNGAL
ncbi:MAG TPA: sigma factor-like helix-turn-helix DNA-binding protein [Bacillota bacterium]|jgi:predicted DNA-binding protein YlxM (UPF0122 family)|nr:sigma factor-like helix-turn-helix DNA-binding protein [Bacillota bacterium]